MRSRSAQQLQVRHDVPLVLLVRTNSDLAPSSGPPIADDEEEPAIVVGDVLQGLRGIVVEIWRGIPDAPERRDLERVEVIEDPGGNGKKSSARPVMRARPGSGLVTSMMPSGEPSWLVAGSRSCAGS